MNRRELIQTAAALAFVPNPSLFIAEDGIYETPVFAWGFIDDPAYDSELMAARVVRAMENTLRGYDVKGWRMEPTWEADPRFEDGVMRYKMTCRPIIRVEKRTEPDWSGFDG